MAYIEPMHRNKPSITYLLYICFLYAIKLFRWCCAMLYVPLIFPCYPYELIHQCASIMIQLAPCTTHSIFSLLHSLFSPKYLQFMPHLSLRQETEQWVGFVSLYLICNLHFSMLWYFYICNCCAVYNTGLILGLCPANERWRYFVTTSLIGWAQA